MSAKRAWLEFAVASSLVLLVTGCALRSGTAAPPSAAHGIVGSWSVVQVQAAVPGRAPGAPNLITFGSDGTVVVSSALATFSGGNGTWMRTGDRRVAATHVFVRRNPAGEFIGTAKVRQVITLNEALDAFTGEAKTEFFDTQGVLVQSFNPVTQATRIRLESP